MQKDKAQWLIFTISKQTKKQKTRHLTSVSFTLKKNNRQQTKVERG